MALTEASVIDQITILESGHLQVRRADRVLRDGAIVSETYHRHVLAPGDDLAAEDPTVQAHAAVAWTPAVVQAHQARMVAALTERRDALQAALADREASRA